MANLSRSVVLNILGLNKNAKDAVDEVNTWGDEIDARNPVLRIGADISAALAKLSELKALKDVGQTFTVTADVETGPAEAKLAGFNAIISDLSRITATPKVDLNVGTVAEQVAIIAESIKNLSGMIANPKIDINDATVLAQIEAIKAAIASVHGETISLGIDVKGLGLDTLDEALGKLQQQAAASSGAIVEDFDNAGKSIDNTKGSFLETALAATTLNSMIRVGTGAWGAWGSKVELFGGVLSKLGLTTFPATVGVIHLLADSIIEIIAVLGPALIAFGAFGIAATQAVEQITTRMKSLYTVTEATGQPVGILSQQFEKVQNAVQPAVMELFGDALTVVNSKSGIFAKLATETASVLETLGARFVNAATGANGLGGIISHSAVPDLEKIGQVIGNVLGFLGNLGHDLPGYAQMILQIAVGFTGFIEALSSAIGWLIKAALAVHGFLLYVGLAITAVTVFANSLIGKLVVALVQIGIAVTGLAIAFVREAVATDVATAATVLFRDTIIATLATNPITWIAAIVIALGALAFAAYKADGGMSAFITTLKTQIANDAASTAVVNISTQMGVLNEKIKTLHATTANAGSVIGSFFHAMVDFAYGNVVGGIKNIVGAFKGYNAVNEATSYLKQLDSEQLNLVRTTGMLMQSGYNYAQALGIMNLAGVKASDTFAIMKTKVDSLLQGYEAMGVQAGRLNAAVNAVDLQQQQQQSQVQALTQAYSNFISLVTGGQSAFVTFAQGLATMKNDAHAAGASIDGLGASSLTLRGDFEQNITSATSLINALTLQAAASGNSKKSADQLTAAGRDVVASMLQQAKGSQQATSQLYALAQLAGYKGVDSFQALSKWAGNSNNALSGLNKIAGQMTVGVSNLSHDVTNLANSLKQTLTSAQSTAIFLASGGQKDFNAFANAVKNSKGSLDNLGPSAKDAYAEILRMNHGAVGPAQAQFYAFAHAAGLSSNAAAKLTGEVSKTTSAIQGGHPARAGHITDTKNEAAAANAALGPLGKLAQDILRGGQAAAQTHPSRAQLIADFHNSTSTAQIAQGALNALTSATSKHGSMTAAYHAVRAQLAQDVKDGGINAGAARALIDQLTTSVSKHGSVSAGTHAFRLQLAQDIKDSGVNAAQAKTLLDALTTATQHHGDVTAATHGPRIQLVDDLKNTSSQAADTTTKVDANSASIQHHGEVASATHAARQQVTDDLKNLGGQSQVTTGLLDIDSASITHHGDVINATHGARQQIIADLKLGGDTAQVTTGLINNLTDAINKDGSITSGLHGARQQLISDLKSTGQNAQQATGLVNSLTDAINKLPKDPNIKLTMAASGTWTISQSGGTPAATGWKVPGYGGGDRWPAMLEGGEAVVPKHLVAPIAPYLAAHNVPGFSHYKAQAVPHLAGGLFDSSYHGNGNGEAPWVTNDYNTTVKDEENSMESTVAAAIKKAKAAAVAAAANFGPNTSFGKDIFDYLLANVFAGNKFAAAGAIASIWGESTWNPDAENCVPLTYKVVTMRGILSHDEVEIGDFTPVYDPETGEIVEAEILDVPYHYDARMCRIGNDNWSVICTTDHKWIASDATRDNQLIRADMMRMGQTVIRLGPDHYENVEFFEFLGHQDTFCLTTSTGTWTVYRDEEVAKEEGTTGKATMWTGNTGGRGLIGWTPAGDLPNYAFTGNKIADLNAQLPLIVKFIQTSGDEGVIAEMRGTNNILDAANLWGKGVERYGINDVHAAGLAAAAQIAGLANGGMITEPIIGTGLHTGINYAFGERGPELITPAGAVHSNRQNSGGDIHISVNGDTDPDGAALRIWQKLRDYKRRHGNIGMGLG